MSDEYDHVVKGPLRVKHYSKAIKKSKKQKIDKSEETNIKLTRAEINFQKMQEKMEYKRVIEKAMKTHKQRVEEFNSHLDSITEHFDIPKVSWTK